MIEFFSFSRGIIPRLLAMKLDPGRLWKARWLIESTGLHGVSARLGTEWIPNFAIKKWWSLPCDLVCIQHNTNPKLLTCWKVVKWHASGCSIFTALTSTWLVPNMVPNLPNMLTDPQPCIPYEHLLWSRLGLIKYDQMHDGCSECRMFRMMFVNICYVSSIHIKTKDLYVVLICWMATVHGVPIILPDGFFCLHDDQTFWRITKSLNGSLGSADNFDMKKHVQSCNICFKILRCHALKFFNRFKWVWTWRMGSHLSIIYI